MPERLGVAKVVFRLDVSDGMSEAPKGPMSSALVSRHIPTLSVSALPEAPLMIMFFIRTRNGIVVFSPKKHRLLIQQDEETTMTHVMIIPKKGSPFPVWTAAQEAECQRIIDAIYHGLSRGELGVDLTQVDLG